jgi:hypothetical protein
MNVIDRNEPEKNKSDKIGCGSNHWWEFYFVRYFVGTVVGGAIVLYLNTSKASSLHNLIIPILTDISQIDVQLFSLLAALGLAYCYVASAPVLVFHATRGVLVKNSSGTGYWLFFVGFLVLVVGAVSAFCFCAELSIISYVLLAIVLLLQLVLLGFSIHKKGEGVHDYYLKLTAARSKDTGQYVESYRHLREHGNAFFIIIFELMLGAILANTNVLVVLVFWTAPAALVWLIGTILECRFATPTTNHN